MGLNDNPYDVPQDIQKAQIAAQRRKHGKDIAIRALDEMSRTLAGTQVVDIDQLKYVLQAASASGMDTKRVEQLEAQVADLQASIKNMNSHLAKQQDQTDDLANKLEQTQILLSNAVDRSSAVVKQLNQVTEQAMHLRQDKKHLMRVLEMYVSKM